MLKSTREKASHKAIKQQLIVAGKVLVAQGQDDFTRGHISFRLPDDPGRFFMKAHSLGLDEITPQNILTIDLDGKVVAGTARRHSEVFIHSEIFKARADVNCVIHTHPTYSIALSSTGRPLKCYSQPGALFYEALGVYADTINLIRSPAMGAGVARALGRGRAVLLKNHGVVVTGAQHRGGGDRHHHAGERRHGAIARRSRRRPGAGISARRHRAAQERHQPARAVSDQFRLSGAARETRRQVMVRCRQAA